MGWKDWFKGKSEQEPALEITVELTAIGGAPEIESLFIQVPADDVLRGLDGWKWLPISGLTAVAVSAFGEVFFRDANGAILQIDTIEGKLSKVANTLSEFEAILQAEETRDAVLLEGFVIGAKSRGLLLSDGECYDFAVAPILGGEMSSMQMQTISFVVKLHIAGQLHEQVRGLPPGTKIGNVSIAD